MIVVMALVGRSPSGASAASEHDDEVTPLIITTLGADPIPVKGSDDKFHVAYELSALNYHPNAAVLTSLDTLAPDGRVVSTWSEEELRAVMMVVPDLSLSGAPATGIPSGGTGILVLETCIPTARPSPARSSIASPPRSCRLKTPRPLASRSSRRVRPRRVGG